MSITDNSDSNWKILLEEIGKGNVIPVIGQGLYCMETETGEEVLLYDYLATKMVESLRLNNISSSSPKFSQIAFHFLKKNKLSKLKQFIEKTLPSVQMIPASPLWKLARIKPFSIFINTTHDHFLINTLNRVRDYTTEVLFHSFKEKRTDKVKQEILDDLEAFNRSLICYIYGSSIKNKIPAYTENDILETVVTLQRDIETEPRNPFFQTLEEKSLLFIGCGYDDWLFRFFVRTIANEPFQTSEDPQKWKFVSDDVKSFNSGGLKQFLEAYNSNVFFSSNGKNFVDELFDRINPKHIISETEFPETAFISFCRTDRETARLLASHLRNDGIKVWLDERKMKPGDGVDNTIIRAIGKCPVFIPLISESAMQLGKNSENLNYHIREWERAHSERVAGNNPKVIMPVKIDETKLMYGPFKGDFYVHIPKGEGNGKYEVLRGKLLELQNKMR
ncbi:MAG: toll/interleukin-1 receptor domain-containing protein [Candidatus Aminicenantes bacterium]|nr:toll/interleukin-1 receptor domain-containing protein [Candidatus Aminicenantes bacterium]